MLRDTLKYLAVALILILIWKFAWDYMQFHENDPVRVLGDIWDLRVYYFRGKWFPEGSRPYVDVTSEYPQIATYLFGVIHFFSRNAPRAGVGRELYFHTFSLVMIGLAYLSFVMVSLMRDTRKWMALLLFLPGPLYFTLYRFDVLPSFICLLAIFLIRKRYYSFAAILLGIATLTKWYAILLLPPLVIYIWTIERRIPLISLLAYTVTCILIVMPTIISGGIDALFGPYQYHALRGIETASLPGYLSVFIDDLLPVKVLINLFLILAIAPSAASLFFKIDSYEMFENWALLVIGSFILFSRIFSPQWIVWILPLLILRAESFFDFILIVAYGILVYVGFPIAYDLKSSFLPMINLLSLTPLFILLVRCALRIKWEFSYSSFVPLKSHGKL